ncbi:MAG: hypothetical protein IT196_02835 [Acidimicrobiales bacterium]|nr:hypothetical protein [Acidimicrobiales bacterium]
MEAALLVPIHLDALHVTEPVAVVGPTLPYWHLPHVADGVVRHRDVPFLALAVERQTFHESGQRLAPGVHLHWSMPDALTRQDAAGAFPPLPDRWVVRRTGGELATRTWMIDAGAVRFAERIDEPAACIPWEQGLAGDGPPFAWLGVTRELHDEAGDDAPVLHQATRLDPLTAVVGGEITFAALYSRCAGVFGFHDDEIGAVVPPGLTYLLYGYHGKADHDAVVRLAPRRAKKSEPQEDRLRTELGWRSPLSRPTRSLYYAALELPLGNPASAPEPSSVEVGLGNTTAEALAAMEAGSDRRLEAALAAMRFLAEHGRLGVDLDHALAEFRHDEGFHAVDGGRRWVLRPLDRQPDAAAPPAQPEGAERLAEALGALSVAQDDYDAAQLRIRSLRALAFADWCRYLECSYPHEGARLADLPDIDEVRDLIERTVLDPLEELVAATGEIEWIDRGEREHVEPRVRRAVPGERARRVAELWHELSHLLDVLPGGPTHELVLAPGQRYFAPRELSIVLAGDGVEPSVRHNDDGRLDDDGLLDCWGMELQGADARRADRDAVFSLLAHRFSRWSTGGEPPSIGFSRVRVEPWHPLVLEWEAGYEALAHERPAGGHGPYPSGFVRQHFRHLDQQPELGYVGAPQRSGIVPVSGWSLLTRGAAPVLAASIDRYLEELDVHEAEPAEVVAELRDVLARLRSDRPILSATLNGFDDALLMQRRAPQLPIRAPLALPGSVYEAFARRMARAVGRVPGRNPDPAYEFHPLRTGWLRLTGVRLVDNFGRSRRVGHQDVSLPDTLPVVRGDDHAFLPPRLLAPARLRLRWLEAAASREAAVSREAADAGGAGVEVIHDQRSSPVHGWLVFSDVDERVLVFDGDGTRLGAIELDGDATAWVPLGMPVDDPVLAGVIEQMSGGRAAFVAFGEAMAEGQRLIDPVDAGHHRGLALLVGRPIAVARCALTLELAGEAPHTHSWDSFRRWVAGLGRDRAGMEAVEFPVRLGAPPPAEGRLARLDDGLLGFWIDGEVTLRTPKSTVDGPRVASHGSAVSPPEVILRADGSTVGVTVLLDPRGQVHAVSGILPTMRLDLDPAITGRALAAMSIAVRSGPLLTRPGHVDHLESNDPDLRWSWADDEASPQLRDVEPLDGHAPIPAALELRDGFLILSPTRRTTEH